MCITRQKYPFNKSGLYGKDQTYWIVLKPIVEGRVNKTNGNGQKFIHWAYANCLKKIIV